MLQSTDPSAGPQCMRLNAKACPQHLHCADYEAPALAQPQYMDYHYMKANQRKYSDLSLDYTDKDHLRLTMLIQVSKVVRVKSLNNPQTRRNIHPIWFYKYIRTSKIHTPDYEEDPSTGGNVLSLYICSCLFRRPRLPPSTINVQAYRDTRVHNLGLLTIFLHIEGRLPLQIFLQVTDTQDCIILVR